jgi:hypothetical protein
MDLYLLTINSKDQIDENIGIAEKAVDILPKEVRGEVESKGNVTWPDDGKILFKGETYSIFLFKNMIRRLRGYKSKNRLKNPILGLTPTMVIRAYSFLDTKEGKIKQSFFTVNDYMFNDIGFVSLSYSEKEENILSISIAHGIGHNNGLGHHEEPKGIMYWREAKNFIPRDLLYEHLREIYQRIPLRFCQECQNIMKENQNV